LDLVLDGDSGELSQSGPYGALAVPVGASTVVRLRFFRAGTTDPPLVALRSFFFSLFDMGGGDFGEEEAVGVSDLAKYTIDPDSLVQHKALVGGMRFYTSGGGGATGARTAGRTAPADPLACTAEQARRITLLHFEGRSDFLMRFEVKGAMLRGSTNTFLFAGRSCLTEACTEPASSSAAPVVAAALVPGGQPTTTVEKESYDCTALLDDWRTVWSYNKKYWCCVHEELGCYDCTQDPTNWDADRRDWCCRAENVACAVALRDSPAPASTTHECSEKQERWREEWSLAKKEWCCSHVSLGCYDCTGSPDGWPSDHADFCCESVGIGCAVAAEYLCEPDGDEDWQASWSNDKKEMCCSKVGFGCQATMRFQRLFNLVPMKGMRSLGAVLPVTLAGVAVALSLVVVAGRKRVSKSMRAMQCTVRATQAGELQRRSLKVTLAEAEAEDLNLMRPPSRPEMDAECVE